MLPISRLPDEILSQIYTISKLPPYDHAGVSLPTTVATQVCHRWRRVALKQCSLWDTIRIASESEFEVEAAELYLSRSGDVPLRIVINYEHIVSDMRTRIMHNILLPRLHRVVEYYIIDDDEPEDPSFYHIPAPAPNLRSFSFNAPSAQLIRSEHTNSFQLRDLFWYNQSSQAFELFQLQQLKSLSILGNLSLLDVVQTINRCPSLEILDWTHWGTSSGGDNDSIVVSLPKLRVARLSGTLPLRVLSASSCPALEILEINRPQDCPRMLSSPPCFPSLKTLSIRDTPVSSTLGVPSLLKINCDLETIVLSTIPLDLNGLSILGSIEDYHRQHKCLHRVDIEFGNRRPGTNGADPMLLAELGAIMSRLTKTNRDGNTRSNGPLNMHRQLVMRAASSRMIAARFAIAPDSQVTFMDPEDLWNIENEPGWPHDLVWDEF